MRRGVIAGCTVLALLLVVALGCLAVGLWQLRPARQVALPATPTASPIPTGSAPAAPSPRPPTATIPPFDPPTATPLPPTIAASPLPDSATASLAAISAAQVPARDIFDLARRFGIIPLDAPRIVNAVPPVHTVGDTLSFFVSNISDNSHREHRAVLRYQSEHANWWVQEGFSIPEADLARSARVFEEQTYPTNRRLFGSEWSPGVDNDVRLHIFMGEVPGVAGYYASTDEFPRTINPFSNEKEMFYINLENARPGDDYFDGILAHEFQHMIHWNEDRNEDLWANEGLSELAADLNGFPVGGFAHIFARAPDLQLTTWSEESPPHYGAAYLFMRYLHDRFGAELLRAIVAAPGNGAAGIDAALAPHGLTFDELFADWVAANYLDEPRLAGGVFSYADRETPRPTLSERHDSYPAEQTATVAQYGSDYIRFEPAGGRRGTLRLDLTGETAVSLLPTRPPSGAFFAWSNRGDDADSRLTRAFDLTGLTAATLEFDAWYDLESGWDYAYIAVSTDGGSRWQPLPATTTTERNPSGNAFGVGFTGRSGVGPEVREAGPPARWVRERVDLTPFAGRPILLRFEMVTDDALNRPGLAVDNITLPALGYSEDFEAGLGGWVGEGFVRVGRLLPQRLLVQAIIHTADGGARVERLALDETNEATLTIPGFGAEVGSVVLVVSGRTPVTTEPAVYRYRAAVGP